MRLPVEWFEKRHVGDIWSRFSAVQQIQKTLTTSFIEAVLDGLLVVLTLAMMFVYSGTLTAVALAAVAAYALLRWAFFRPLRDATEEALVHEAKQSSHFLESLRGVQAIKLFNAQADRQSRFTSLVVDTMNADLATRKLELLFAVLHRLLFGLERVAVVWIGALLVLDQKFSVGMLFAFFAYKEQFASRVSGLIDKVVELKMLRLQGERLADIVLTAPEQEDATGPCTTGRRDPGHRIARRELPLFRWRARRAERRQPAHRAGRVGGHRRPFGLRQDHAAEADAGHPRAAVRRVADRRRAAGAAGPARLARHGRRGDAGRAAVFGLDRRQHQLLRPAARHGLGRALRPRGRGARRDRGHADGLPHADRRHGLQPVGRAEAAHPAGARAVQAAEDPAAGRGHQRARRRGRAPGQPGRAPAGADAGDRRAPARDHRQRGPRGGAARRPRGAGPAQRRARARTPSAKPRIRAFGAAPAAAAAKA